MLSRRVRHHYPRVLQGGSSRFSLRKDGRLKGSIRIEDGDSSTFVAVRTEDPNEPIDEPPSYRDK